MSSEQYPDEVEIVETNFKTDQQSDAAEKIAEEWPVDLDRLAEEGQHVKMFYKQVLEQFLGPADADATFAEIKDEYGSLEQWAENGDPEPEAEDVDVPDVDDIDPGVGGDGSTPADATTESDDAGPESSVDASPESTGGKADAGDLADIDASDLSAASGGDVDAKRRAWFRAGFREGIEFALENPDLFESE
ncbi:hypothetical protein [Halapricum hydrolyticum]|uniref:Uncharacterized protein n=1 Tax=Halapricum hydrolyticum TaxID=2979991 RepID=A0AAE3ICU4_9EURY|nr:hypothetical protein [Halapricum hydrolyticum]MCU4717302.1 hypothetical protein [Halapricum hydrolyticum]MCU4726229.1 hypothetical protein [Halapricum hydrolyticum]